MSRYKPIALGVALALGIGTVVMAEAATPSAQKVTEAIPPMPLKEALHEFSQREHLQMVYLSQITDGMRTKGAKAGLSQRATLAALLRGTGLQFRYIDPNTVVISKAKRTSDTDTTGTPPSANADQATSLQTVVVTGSHIRSAELATANPTIAVTSEQIQQTGDLTLGQVLQDMPALVGPTSSPGLNNGGTDNGGTYLGVHGMGSGRTLLLINGQRVLNKNLNAIPATAVGRIEILTDGASSVYGSDAIGGVINVILKSNYEGGEVQANYGISSHNDGSRTGVSFTFGQTTDKGSILAVLSYNKTNPVWQTARWFSRQTLSVAGSTNTPIYSFVSGDTFTPRGFIALPANLQPQFGCREVSLNPGAYGQSRPATLSDFHCYDSTKDGQQDSIFDPLTQPQKHVNVLVNSEYNISSNVTAKMTLIHNVSRGEMWLTQPLWSTVTGATVSEYSLYNPFGVTYSPTSGNQMRFTMGPLPARHNSVTDTSNEVMLALNGNFDLWGNRWTWDIGYNFGYLDSTEKHMNFENLPEITAGAGPSMYINGVPSCVATPGDPSTVIAGCTPWDPFNMNNPVDLEVLGQSQQDALERTRDIERIEYGDISGGLFELPGGTAQLALGVLRREEHSSFTVGPALLINSQHSCIFGTECSAPLSGGYDVKNLYGELYLPLVSDVPFVHSLSVDLGDRYSKFSDFGSANNTKIGVEYRPVTDLLVRGTVAEVFRAPTISNLYAPQGFGAVFISRDPCNGITASNPACSGVPLDGTFVNSEVANHSQTIIAPSGSEAAGFKLKPEQGKSFDFGLVYSPHQVNGFSVNVDFWRIYLNDIISHVSAQTVLNGCFAGLTSFCPLIHRFGADTNAPGQLERIGLPVVNLGRLDTKGVDFGVTYQLPSLPIGQFNVKLHGTYITQDDLQTAPGLSSNVRIGGAGVYNGDVGLGLVPRVRGLVTLGWRKGPWAASWRIRYIGPWDLGSGQVARGYSAVGGFDLPVALHYGATVYSAIQGVYDINSTISINVGVNNLFDKQPPIFYNRNDPESADGNTDGRYFDVVGRYYWTRLTVKF